MLADVLRGCTSLSNSLPYSLFRGEESFLYFCYKSTFCNTSAIAFFVFLYFCTFTVVFLYHLYEKKMTVRNQPIKDRGWSWVVLAAVSFAQLLALGQILSFGIFFVVLLDEFSCTRQEAALVGALAFGVKCFTSAPASVAQRKYGCRFVVMLGGLLASTGFFLSYFATSLWHLYLSYGLLVGSGFGCTFVPSVGAIPDYFDKYRYFATAFAPVGSALGTFLFSPFYYYLIETYTWRGAVLILSGVTSQIIVCGSVLKSRTIEKNLTWSNSMEKSLFKKGKFLLFLCDAFCFGGSTYIVFAMANSLSMKFGLNKEQSTRVVAAMGFCNLAGRLISSVASTRSRLNRPLLFAIASLCCGLGSLASTMCQTWWALAMALGFYGLFFGIKVSQLAPVIIELFGVQKLVNGMGYYMFIVGISGILGPWLGGLLADKTGIESAYWLAGSLSMIAAFICFAISIWHNRSSVKEPQHSHVKGDQIDEDAIREVIDIGVASASEIELKESIDQKLDSERSLSHKRRGTPEPTPRRGWRPALLSFGEA